MQSLFYELGGPVGCTLHLTVLRRVSDFAVPARDPHFSPQWNTSPPLLRQILALLTHLFELVGGPGLVLHEMYAARATGRDALAFIWPRSRLGCDPTANERCVMSFLCFELTCPYLLS